MTLPTDNLSKKYIDNDYGSEELSNTRLHIVKVRPLLDGYGVVKRPRLTHRLIGALMTRTLCSSGGDWLLPLSNALNCIEQKSHIELIVSTGGPFIPFLAVTRFAEKMRIPCIIDYRDLWSRNPRAPYPWIFRFFIGRTIERYVNGRSTVITTVSEGCRQSLHSAQPSLNIKTLLNTPDRDYLRWFNAARLITKQFDESCLNIVLTGTVYQECTCRLLARSITLLPKGLQRRIKLHYFGSSTSLVEADFSSAGIAENLVNYGFVDKGEAVAAVKSADMLLSLVCDSTRYRNDPATTGIMTTKIFDYFLSGRPIINIGPPGGDINVLAKNIGYHEFHSFHSSQERELTEFLALALSDLKQLRQREAKVALPDFSDAFERILRDVQNRQ